MYALTDAKCTKGSTNKEKYQNKFYFKTSMDKEQDSSGFYS